MSTSFGNLLSAIPGSSAKTAGISWGQSVAQQLLTHRSDDGADTSDPYIPINDIGVFDGSWGSQQYRNVAPYSAPGHRTAFCARTVESGECIDAPSALVSFEDFHSSESNTIQERIPRK